MPGVGQLGPGILQLSFGILQLLQRLIFPVPVFLLALQVLLLAIFQLCPPVGDLLFPLGKLLFRMIQLEFSRVELYLSRSKLIFRRGPLPAQFLNSQRNLLQSIFQLCFCLVQFRRFLIQQALCRLDCLQLGSMLVPGSRHFTQRGLKSRNRIRIGTIYLCRIQCCLYFLHTRILRGNCSFQLRYGCTEAINLRGNLCQAIIDLLKVAGNCLQRFLKLHICFFHFLICGTAFFFHGLPGIHQRNFSVTDGFPGFRYLPFSVFQLPLGMAKLLLAVQEFLETVPELFFRFRLALTVFQVSFRILAKAIVILLFRIPPHIVQTLPGKRLQQRLNCSRHGIQGIIIFVRVDRVVAGNGDMDLRIVVRVKGILRDKEVIGNAAAAHRGAAPGAVHI